MSINLQVNNVVCNVNVHASINVKWLAYALDGRLGDQVFPACVSLCREPRTTNSTFATGQIVVAGAKNSGDALLSSILLIRRMRKVMNRVDLFPHQFEVQNIVLSGEIGFRIDLDLFFHEHKVHCTYDPELFTGLTYRTPATPTEPSTSLVFFPAGTFLVIGLKSNEDQPRVIRHLQILHRYRLGDRPLPDELKRARVTKVRITGKRKKCSSSVQLTSSSSTATTTS